MKYFLIAGEPSGDLHGATFISALKRKDPNAIIQAWGGDRMQQAGATIKKHCRELSIFGLWEVIVRIGDIMSNFKQCKQDITLFQPNVIIFIDYPGFNLRMLKWAKQQGYHTVYYIIPQVWAWKKNRIHTLKQYSDDTLVILPFEKTYCEEHAVPVHYVGHPLVEHIEQYQLEKEKKKEVSSSQPCILLLPGSRISEIKRLLPIMVGVAKHFPDERFEVLVSSSIDEKVYSHYMSQASNIQLRFETSLKAFSQCKAAVVKSGTSTLEAALMGVPELVVYRMNMLNYTIGKMVINPNLRFISLANLIADKGIVKEYIQGDCNVRSITEELKKLVYDEVYIAQMKKEFDRVKSKLYVEKMASEVAADIVLQKIQKTVIS